MPVAGRGIRIRHDVELANLSDVGCERTENEDYFLYVEPDDDGEFEDRGRLILVADGMGGRNGGAVASRLAAETVRDIFWETSEDSERETSEEGEPRAVLIAGFQAAQRAILDLAAVSPELRGMGTTCCACILKNGRMYYAHVGDSRIYLIRDGRAEQLTEDHSLVARMVRNGQLSEEEARHHEKRNILTAALGMDTESVAGDFSVEPLELMPEDTILLCTDGLHGLVSDEEMASITRDLLPTDACRELVDQAKLRGGPDNITVQLLRVRDVES
jgi:serine/threonine protein phosphatase PrpC